jgi:hypothetical protein
MDEKDQCGVCGASLLEARSEPLEDLLKERSTEVPGQRVNHWKRRALLPSLVFLGLAVGLIIPGFFLLLFSQPSFRGFTPFFVGFLLLTIGFLGLLFVVIGTGPSELGMD